MDFDIYNNGVHIIASVCSCILLCDRERESFDAVRARFMCTLGIGVKSFVVQHHNPTHILGEWKSRLRVRMRDQPFISRVAVHLDTHTRARTLKTFETP